MRQTMAGIEVESFDEARTQMLEDGQWVTIEDKIGHLIVCCDCGLVHLMQIRRRDDRYQVRFYRQEKLTRDWRSGKVQPHEADDG